MFTNFLSKLSQLNNFYILSILFIFVIFCYGITLGNGLFFDDEQFIYNNQAVINFDLPHLITKSLSSESGEVSNYYRPLLFTGFSIEYQLFKDNGFIYHLDSFFLHFMGGALLFLLLKKLFEDQLYAFLSSLLFLIHPIQTEAIAYASGRGDPLSFFFILLTLLLITSQKRKYYLLSFITLIAALLSKEIALMSPGLIFLIFLFSKKSFSRNAIVNSLIKTLPYALITGTYFILRISVLNFNNTLNFYNSANIYSSNLLVRLETFISLFPTYLGLLIYPNSLFMERDAGIQIMTSLNIQIVITVLGITAAICIAFWKRKKWPSMLFSLLWIAITFIPTSGILPINGIFYEHFLFFPSVGFFLIFSYIFLSLYRKTRPILKEGLCLLLFLIILFLCFRTIARNREWHDPITFYNQTLSHVQSPRAYNNLAMAYADEGQPNQAISTYHKAIALGDAYPETHYNLANTYTSILDTDNAEKEYKKAVLISPTFYLSYIKLYSIYQATDNKAGLKFVHDSLTKLGQSNSEFLTLLNELEKK
jgi:tetratricopeptide (TPR) repeat protein